MALEIQTSDAILAPWTAWFLYGGSGAGKTRAAASFPNPLFLIPANEGSELTLRQLEGRKIDFIRLGKAANGQVLKVRDHINAILTDLEKGYAELRRCLAEADKCTADDDATKAAKAAWEAAAIKAFPWETIVLESYTHLGDMLVEDVSDYGRKKMDQQGWGLISTFLRTVHSRLRNLDVHIVYTALAKAQTNEDGGVIGGGPALIGSMAEKLPSACDVVVYLEELPGKPGAPIYRAFFRKYKMWQARTRFGGFPDFMDSFDFRELEKKLA